MQALHLLALEPVSETRADWNSYGFRSARSTADAIRQCHTILSGHDKAQWILEGDIEGCLDPCSHYTSSCGLRAKEIGMRGR